MTGRAVLPVLEFLHEVRSAGVIDVRLALQSPQEAWNALPPGRRELLQARLELAEGPSQMFELKLVKRRNSPPTPENVFVHISAPASPGLDASIQRARDFLLYEPFTFPSAPAPPRAGTLFTHGEAAAAPRVLDILDAAWGGVPYDVAFEGPFVDAGPPTDYEETERYWVEEPFALVTILQDASGERTYHAVEPPLSDLEQALLATVNARLRDTLLLHPQPETTDRRRQIAELAFTILRSHKFRTDRRVAYKLGYYLLRNYLGFGRLEPVMRDVFIEDVSCNGADVPVYVVHSRHQNLRTNVKFSEAYLDAYTVKLAQRGGKLLSLAQPLVDASLPDGSRIQASLGREVTSRGSAFTIRKFRADPLTCVDLIRGGTHSLDTMAFLWLAVELARNVVVMGATASGKTTTLNVLSQFIPPASKVVSIEDTRELMLKHENWLAAATRDSFAGAESDRISMYDLLRAALRQRPEYILVGEIRGEEGLTLFQAMSTGHTCFSTMHAGSLESAVHRLENPPISVPRVMLTSLDFFILQGQVDRAGKAARRMLLLAEVTGVDATSRNLRMNEIFRWDEARDGFVHANMSHALDAARTRRGWTRSRLQEELQARRRLLDQLVRENKRHTNDVSRAIQAFYNERNARPEAPKADEAPADEASNVEVSPRSEGG